MFITEERHSEVGGTRGRIEATVEPSRPPADAEWENKAAGDDAMEDDLTEERDATPEQREEVAHDQPQDP